MVICQEKFENVNRKRLLPSPLGKVSALPTKEVIAFPFGEGVGIADGRGLCLPLLGKVSALPTEEVIAFPFGEGVGIADGRGHCLPPLGKVSALPTKEVYATESVPTWRTLCKFLLNLGEMPLP